MAWTHTETEAQDVESQRVKLAGKGRGCKDFQDGIYAAALLLLKGRREMKRTRSTNLRPLRRVTAAAVAFEMRGGGVCDDIMDILLLGDHTVVGISPHRRETLSNKFLELHRYPAHKNPNQCRRNVAPGRRRLTS